MNAIKNNIVKTATINDVFKEIHKKYPMYSYREIREIVYAEQEATIKFLRRGVGC